MRRSVKEHFPGDSWEDYYRRYQKRLARDFLLPVLRSWGVQIEGEKVLEVGSGNGGCGEAFAEAGALVTALEIDERLVDVARSLNRRAGLDINVYHGDICDGSCPVFEGGPFKLALMRDVIEHLETPGIALSNVKENLDRDGFLFVVFPPYYSPYGAHQQILAKKKFAFVPYNKLPFIQLLPDRVFLALVRGEDSMSKEVERLRRIKLTISGFEHKAREAGFRVRERKYYISRPTFSIRYGLPVVGAGAVGKIRGLRELLVTAAYYLLEPV